MQKIPEGRKCLAPGESERSSQGRRLADKALGRVFMLSGHSSPSRLDLAHLFANPESS